VVSVSGSQLRVSYSHLEELSARLSHTGSQVQLGVALQVDAVAVLVADALRSGVAEQVECAAVTASTPDFVNRAMLEVVKALTAADETQARLAAGR